MSADQSPKLTPGELLRLLQRAVENDFDEECPADAIDQIAAIGRSLIHWAYSSLEDDLAVQSLHITCVNRRYEKEGDALIPLKVFPFGDEITPEDCIALGHAGAGWALSALMIQKAKIRRQIQEEKERRIIVPGRRMPN